MLAIGATSLAPPAAAEGPTLYVFDCGHLTMKQPAMFLPDVDDAPDQLVMGDTCYLIDHPAGTLVWDTGLPDSWFVRTFANIVGMRMGSFSIVEPFETQLEAAGFPIDEIDYVALSHMHFDHAGNANKFAGATWIVQKAELEAAFDDEQIEKAGFFPFLYSDLEGAEKRVIEGDHDVFGDGSVVIVSTPGHTPGHQSLLVDLEETGPVLLSGDLYHTVQNRERQLAPAFNTNREETVRSMQLVEALLARTGAQLWIQHNVKLLSQLKLAPEAYK